MAKFNFKSIFFCKPQNLGEGNFIWVWNADKIPPHLGFSAGKTYYSLTFRKNECKSVVGMIRKANRLKIPILFIEVSDSWMLKPVEEVFFNYTKAEAGVNTCLTPIREILGMDETIQQLANLLTELEHRTKRLSVFALHLTESYSELPEYSVSDIITRIEELNHAKR